MRYAWYLIKCVILPLQLCLRVKLHMRNGSVLHGNCTNLSHKHKPDGYTEISADGCHRWPSYLIDEVVAIEYHRGIRFRFYMGV